MRMSQIAGVVCFGLLLCAATAARGDDQVDDPRFAAWAKFGVGSSETLNGVMDNGQFKVASVNVRKLVEKTDDHVTIEIVATVNMMGQSHTSAPIRQTYNTKMDKKDFTQLDDEKVDAAGKTFNCKVYELPNTGPNGQQAKARIWVSDQVPGGLVKMVINAQRGTVTQTLDSYDAK